MEGKRSRYVLVGLAFVALSACASDGRRAERAASAPQDTIDRAAASISDAERNGGSRYGTEDLNRARDKLNAARKAMQEGDDDVAQRLAEEARLDAEVASATASNGEMQNALREVNQSINTLQGELQRQAPSSRTEGAGASR